MSYAQITRVQLDNDSEQNTVVEITLVRYPADRLPNVKQPDPFDLPQEFRDALDNWLPA